MKIAFPPIIDQNSVVLILGTMPSEESLRRHEYYGHKTNQFWRLIFTVFSKEHTNIYADKVKLLQSHKIALWDVIKCCEGKGSADTAIKNEQANDFSLLFQNYPKIRTIIFSSKKAEEFYSKYVGKHPDITYYTLPSPSTANARLSFEDKLKKWQLLTDITK